MVYIVGIGPGHKDYILPKAVEILEKSDIVLGFDRAIASLDFINIDKLTVSSLTSIVSYIETNPSMSVSIAASGDPCYYGIVDYMGRNYKGEVEVIPGISSFQYLTARLNKPWQGSFLGSLHGRSEDFIEKVRTNKLSIWLTDKTNNPSSLCEKLKANDIRAMVYVGENLSYEDERIVQGTPEELMNMTFVELCVVIIQTM